MTERMGAVFLFSASILAMCMARDSFERAWCRNRGMIQLTNCLISSGWISDLDRIRRPRSGASPPDSACLRTLHDQADSPRGISTRLELIDGDVAVKNEDWSGAVAHYRSAIKLADRPAPGIWNDIVGIEAWKLKDYRAAQAASLEGLKRSPENQNLRVDAAIMYLYYIPPYNRYREALEVMRPELGFSHPYHYNIAAGAYSGLGQLNAGLRMAKEAVRLARATHDRTNLVTGLYLEGVLQRCSGDTDAGFANLREALSLSPHDERIRAAFAEDIAGICGRRTLGK